MYVECAVFVHVEGVLFCFDVALARYDIGVFVYIPIGSGGRIGVFFDVAHGSGGEGGDVVQDELLFLFFCFCP